ncbi:MAG: tRNA uracil 4-sulfurtransferase ThiI [Candidatus Marinimicrobia bacterium]|nr:tRNA uracil 4-sulfurtransferase ThiI [Candidatus Neomarinimicrobiota bacterium]
MVPTHILCHYGEIGTKGKNRRQFERKLKDNMKAGLKAACPGSYAEIRTVRGRIVIELSEIGNDSLESMKEVLRNTFGLVYFAPATRMEQKKEILEAAALELVKTLPGESFRITTRRSDPNIPLSTQKMNEEIGAAVVEKFGKKVNLTQPDVNCHIDLVEDSAFVYAHRIDGFGGLPVGMGGKVLSMISGGIDSPVATWQMMKRGAFINYLHFHSVPYTSDASIKKVLDVIKVFQKHQLRATLFLAELAPIQEEVIEKCHEKYRIILYRRFMFRIAEALAKREGAHAVITGESLGQVASQTIENMETIEAVTSMPILRPLVGMDKQEIVNKSKEIGTYDISILPDEDCCAYFQPKQPATKATVEQLQKAEENLDVEALVEGALDSLHKKVIES